MTAHEYIVAAANGRIIVSKGVQQTCARHIADLATGAERGLTFSEAKATHVIRFVQQFCKHSQGEWAGDPVILEPWQRALLWILYGWRWTDTGYRRFRYAYIELAKGNGKSLLASALGLYELIAQGEPGAEVYCVATKKDQARIVFAEAERMVQQSPDLKARIKSMRDKLVVTANTASKFEPLSSEEDSLDGPRPQAVIADEIHKWGRAGRELWDVLANALGKRRSPIFIAITTSGSGRESLCWQQHEYSAKVVSGAHPDDTWFSWVCCLDEGDQWDDESVWVKANPNLGVSVKIDELRAVVNKAKGDPASLNGVLRLRLGMWTTAVDAWMLPDKWDACTATYKLEELLGQPCYGGLDLATTIDIAAFVLVFPPYKGRKEWVIIPYFFLPKENIEKRSKIDRVPYDTWARQGLFCLTGGNFIDHKAIRQKIHELAEQFDIREIGYDPWNSSETVTELMGNGFTMVPVRQGMFSMAPPTKRLMELVLRRELAHNNNPILRWMALNVIPDIDAAGNVKPDKSRSREKIDGIVAAIIALSRGMVAPPEEVKKPIVMPFFI